MKQLVKTIQNQESSLDQFGYRTISVPESYQLPVEEIQISGTTSSKFEEILFFVKQDWKLEYYLKVNRQTGKKELDSFKKEELAGKLETFILNFISKFENEGESAAFNDEYVDQLIDETIKSIYKQVFEYRIIIPMIYLSFNEDMEKLIHLRLNGKKGCNFIIFNSNDFKKELSSKHFEHVKTIFGNHFVGKVCIEMYEKGTNPSFVIERARKRANLFISFIRLLYFENNVGLLGGKRTRVYHDHEFMDFDIGVHCYYREISTGYPCGMTHNIDTLSNLEISKNVLYKSNLFTLWNDVDSLKNEDTKNQIQRSVLFSSKALKESDLDIKIILYIMAFESLLLENTTEGPNSYSVILRISILEWLYAAYSGITISDGLYEIYRHRNNIVHGRNYDIAKKEHVNKLENYYYNTLMYLIKFIKVQKTEKMDDVAKRLETPSNAFKVFAILYRNWNNRVDANKFAVWFINKYCHINESNGCSIKGKELIFKNNLPPYIASDIILPLLDDDDHKVRYSALFFLKLVYNGISKDDLNNLENKVGDLFKIDDSPLVVSESALILGLLKNKDAMQYITHNLKKNNVQIKISCMKYIALVGTYANKYELIRLAYDGDEGVRKEVIRTMGYLQSIYFVSCLSDKLSDTSYDVRLYSIYSLGHIKSKTAKGDIENILKTTNFVEIKDACKWALDNINKS